MEPAKELVSPERCTLEVSLEDIDSYNQVLAMTIMEEYFRYYNLSLSILICQWIILMLYLYILIY